ncbi:MAG: 50S ribosomal protein L13 [Muribaculaceae bacterium]|nr:50S ribosomal protein L13 [Muribaculaceae bacterium]
MDTLSYKTLSATPATIVKNWVVIDATDMVLGRLCSVIAKILRGKNKPDYTPNLDCGDNVIVINADKVILNGDKWEKREYLRYTGYPGGQRSFTPADLMAKSNKKTVKAGRHPLFIKVVKGMLPKTKLGAAQLNNLYVYNGAEHPFADVNPTLIDITKLKF